MWRSYCVRRETLSLLCDPLGLGLFDALGGLRLGGESLEVHQDRRRRNALVAGLRKALGTALMNLDQLIERLVDEIDRFIPSLLVDDTWGPAEVHVISSGEGSAL